MDLKHNTHDVLDNNLTSIENGQLNDLSQFMLNKNTFMLGTYYEALWEFYLSHHPDCDLIAKNIQINDNSKKTNPTIGEMDFIYWHKSLKLYVHLEVAIKFYLEVSPQIENQPYSKWIGPKCNDRLDLKFNKLMDHQTQLTQLKCTQQRIKPLIDAATIISRAVLQGRLFVEFIDVLTLNEDYWFNVQNFEKWFTSVQAHYQISFLDKPHWFNLDDTYENGDSQKKVNLTLSNVLNRVNEQTFALPFILKNKNKADIPNRMIFIAPDQWPC